MDFLEAIGRGWERGWNALQGVEFGYLLEPRYLVLAGIVVVLVFFLLYLRARQPKRIRAFRGDTGPVEVSRHALLELVHATCAELPEVRKPAVRVRARGGLHLTVRIQVNGSAHLRETAAQLQSLLKESLESNLGVERLRSIEVLVTGIRKRGKGPVDLNPAARSESAASTPRPAASVVPPPPAEPEEPAVGTATGREGAPPVEEPLPDPGVTPPDETAPESHRKEPGEEETHERDEESNQEGEEGEGTPGESAYPSPAAEAPPRHRRFWKKKT